ncbi:hypothetical protein Gpo141_00002483 [Globisporangium polare]
MQQPGAPPRRQAPATAAEQGPLDWLVPFVPPFLRVNRETRTALFSSLQALSLAALSAQVVAFLKEHGTQLAKYALVVGVWLYGLAWTDRSAPEFTTAYVILTGLGALVAHLYAGDYGNTSKDGISAYSVFNKGGARMLGSLSAEQFENEIRHRLPDHGANDGDNANGAFHGSDEEQDEHENDPEMLLAIQLSLQEKKREDRRARRTTKRR